MNYASHKEILKRTMERLRKEKVLPRKKKRGGKKEVNE
jgi:hypothetical protein